MVAGNLDDVGRQPIAGDTSGPSRTQDLVVATDHVCSRWSREFIQRTWKRRGVQGLWPKAVKWRFGNGPVAVRVEQRASDVAISPHLPELLVRHGQCLLVEGVEHLQLVGRLTEQTRPMSGRRARTDPPGASRVDDLRPMESCARQMSGPRERRHLDRPTLRTPRPRSRRNWPNHLHSAGPVRRRRGRLAAVAVSVGPSTIRRATHRVPTRRLPLT
jgi:hypothetical protein